MEKETTFIATKKKLDEVYNIGVKNGSILMKNEILKKLNRDWKLFTTASELKLMVKILKKINKIKLSPSLKP